MANTKTRYEKDPGNKKMTITREFAAEPKEVWRAWTEPELLEQWWAPKPWRAESKEMDFRVGGHWLYAMVGPNGEKHYGKIEYTDIKPITSFAGSDVFCDENGKTNPDLPGSQWTNTFEPSANGTLVTVVAQFASEADMQKLVEMGFEQGFAAAHENLDALLLKIRD